MGKNPMILITPIIFFASFIGYDLIRGRELMFDKFAVGVLFAIILGMGIYIVQMKKAGK